MKARRQQLVQKSPTIPARKFCLKEKSPARRPGASGFALSREGRGPLCQGRVAWLTAARADHSGGTAADSHGLPRFPGCQLKFQCKPRAEECQCGCSKPCSIRGLAEFAQMKKGSSGFSNWVCAFRRALASPLGNLRGGRAR